MDKALATIVRGPSLDPSLHKIIQVNMAATCNPSIHEGETRFLGVGGGVGTG